VIVVKVGGSLFDHPHLGPGLRQWLAGLGAERVLLVPGGGPVADAVRQLDTAHRLGEEKAHWLALTSLWVTAALLRDLLPGAEYGCHPDADRFDLLPAGTVRILDAHMFCQVDDALLHTWAVTTDSIAARAAVVFGASCLILLKSTDIPPGTPWDEAARRGWVDPHFPKVVAGHGLRVEAVNFRRWLDDHSAPP
jgi:aspartokinase-like uncharacterized kinase